MNQKGNALKEGLIKFLTISGDLIALNFLWLVCSIPIITIGPATNALFDICLKLAEDDQYNILKRFFSTFKKNFKQSLAVGFFSIFVIISLYADINYIFAIEGNLQKLFIIVACIVLAILLITITYVNGLIARYNNTLKGHIINAIKLAFVNPVQTLLMWLVLLFPLLCFLFIKPIILLYIGWFFLLFLVSLPVYICSTILNGIFKKYENNEGDKHE